MENNAKNPLSKITLIWILVSVLLFIVLILLAIFMRSVQSNMLQGMQGDFYPSMTLHGIGMVGLWYVASMAIVVYISYRYLRPSRGVQYFSLICTLIAVVMLFVSTLSGKFASGWYFLYPLPLHGTWPSWSTQLFLSAITILGIGWLVWNHDYLRAIAKRYKLGNALGWHYIRGKTEPEVPPFITITTVSTIACLACLASAVALLIFFYFEMFFGIRNDTLLMKNLTFFFGHLIVNLSMYLGVAVVYEILPEFTDRSWKNNKMVAIAWNFVLIVVIFAYFHHLYMDFAQPLWMQYAGQIASYTSSLPAAIMSIFGGLALVYRSKMKWNLTSSFLFLGLMGWAIGGVAAVIDSTVAVNERFHNTLWVPAHFHTYMLMGLSMMVLGYFYHFVHNLIGKEEKLSLSFIISALYLVGGYGIVGMFYVAGAGSIPRRYATYNWGNIMSGTLDAQIGLLFAFILLIAILLYFVELFRKWIQAFKLS